MEKNQRIRYIIFQDGEFIETVHNKESYYVSTQNEETEKGQTSQHPNENGEGKFTSEQTQKRNVRRSFFSISALLTLFVGFILLFISFENKIEESLPYIHTNSTSPITDTSSSEVNQATIDAKLVNELSYVLHTHHAINNLYEESKASVSKYASGSISQFALETELTNLATQIKTLIAYNESQVSTSEELTELHQTTSVRLNFLLELLREVVTTKNRVLVIDVLNNGIELDQPLFNSQLTNFKSILDAHHIAYTESDGYLSFEFPR